MSNLKMYILVKSTVPIGLGVNSVGHTSLATFLKFKDDPVLQAWLTSKHFRKVTCSVSDKEFEKAKSYPDHVIMTEDALRRAGLNPEIAIGFKPREDWPDFFKSLKLFGSNLRDVSQDQVIKKFIDDVSLTWEQRFRLLEKHHEHETNILLDRLAARGQK